MAAVSNQQNDRKRKLEECNDLEELRATAIEQEDEIARLKAELTRLKKAKASSAAPAAASAVSLLQPPSQAQVEALRKALFKQIENSMSYKKGLKRESCMIWADSWGQLHGAHACHHAA